jgi:hypothetical protein
MLTAYVRRALELPPHVAAMKAMQLTRRLVEQRVRRHRDKRSLTFTVDGPSQVMRRLTISSDDVPQTLGAVLPELTQRYLDHRFDLLGSGWVQVRYGLSAQGLEGHRFPTAAAVQADRGGQWLKERVSAANLPESQRLWGLVEGPYEPIDWQIDFRSGFRWDGLSHYRDLSFGNVAGADVKVPWELSRLQHLPQLAIAHLLATAGRVGFAAPNIYAREVRNQVLDFLATNPPCFGVNWLCPMDVGIRAANILLAIDLLRAGGVTLDTAFERAVANAAAAHARHILANLEWSEAPRSNHYLSDLAGVMFCAIYLPADDETEAWLDFSAQQLGEELIAQFLPDGGNFEGSTNYHRLSAEIGLFAGAALLGVAAERAGAFASAARHRLNVRPPLGSGQVVPGSGAAVVRLQAAVDCVAGWIKPDGRPPQIGDTDSGRLFKLHPVLKNSAGEICEDILDHRALFSAGAALFGRSAQAENTDTWLDGAVIRSLARGRTLQATPPPSVTPVNDVRALAELVAGIRMLAPPSRREVSFELPGLVPEQLSLQFFPDFGLLVLRGGQTYLSLRCASHRPGNYTLGHYHDDDLALELNHGGADVIADPGSYLYTPIRSARDRYRSAPAHASPRPEDRSAVELISPFAIRFNATVRLVHCGPTGLAAVLEGPDWKAFRAVLIESSKITVVDGCAPGPLAMSEPVPVSEGYGRLSERMSSASL